MPTARRVREAVVSRLAAVLASWGRWVLLWPGRVVPFVYAIGWVIGTLALRMPVASHPGGGVGWWEAAFTSMSALCITGLGVVDPAAWTGMGQVVILVLIQVGGFGIMTLTSMLLFTLMGASPRAARVATTETRADHRDIRAIPGRIARLSLAVEGTVALVLTARFLALGFGPVRALSHGVFHAVSAFNNAGFALQPDSLAGYAADPVVMVPICLAIVAGGVGFPVYLELWDRLRGARRRRLASVHLRLTLIGTAVLLVVGFVAVAGLEWRNPATLGSVGWGQRLLGALGGTVFPRTAGFSSFDYASATEPTILLTDTLMMVGGGSASTAGGLKITTLAVLAVTVVSEVAGEPDSVVAGRRLSPAAIRQALTVTVLAAVAVAAGTVAMSLMEQVSVERLSFETISAISNTGLTMALTPSLSHGSWAVLIVLMFLGRVGPTAAVAALVTHRRPRRFTYPQEDPLIG